MEEDMIRTPKITLFDKCLDLNGYDHGSYFINEAKRIDYKQPKREQKHE